MFSNDNDNDISLNLQPKYLYGNSQVFVELIYTLESATVT